MSILISISHIKCNKTRVKHWRQKRLSVIGSSLQPFHIMAKLCVYTKHQVTMVTTNFGLSAQDRLCQHLTSIHPHLFSSTGLHNLASTNPNPSGSTSDSLLMQGNVKDVTARQPEESLQSQAITLDAFRLKFNDLAVELRINRAEFKERQLPQPPQSQTEPNKWTSLTGLTRAWRLSRRFHVVWQDPERVISQNIHINVRQRRDNTHENEKMSRQKHRLHTNIKHIFIVNTTFSSLVIISSAKEPNLFIFRSPIVYLFVDMIILTVTNTFWWTF